MTCDIIRALQQKVVNRGNLLVSKKCRNTTRVFTVGKISPLNASDTWLLEELHHDQPWRS